MLYSVFRYIPSNKFYIVIPVDHICTLSTLFLYDNNKQRIRPLLKS